MRPSRFALLLVLPLGTLPVVASAHMLGLRTAVSRTPASQSNPVSGSNGLSLSGTYEVNDDLGIDVGFGVSKPLPQKPAAGEDKTRADATWDFSLGASYTWGDHWSFMASAFGSKPATTVTSSELLLDKDPPGPNTDGVVPGMLTARSNNLGGMVGATWETAGEDDLEHEIALLVTAARTPTVQKFEPDKGDPDTVALGAQIKCNKKSAAGCAALKGKDAHLDAQSLNLAWTGTWKALTEVTVGATYYNYVQDPDDVGYFTVLPQGKAAAGKEGATFGAGVPIAPYRWTTTVGGSRKLGDVKVALAANYGKYTGDYGTTRGLTLKATYKLTAMWRLAASLGGTRDIDQDGKEPVSFAGSLTVRCML